MRLVVAAAIAVIEAARQTGEPLESVRAVKRFEEFDFKKAQYPLISIGQFAETLKKNIGNQRALIEGKLQLVIAEKIGTDGNATAALASVRDLATALTAVFQASSLMPQAASLTSLGSWISSREPYEDNWGGARVAIADATLNIRYSEYPV